MRYFRRALASEVLKLRRSASLWIVALGPLLMLAFYLLTFVTQDPAIPDARGMLVQTVNTWAGFLLPWVAIVQTGLLAHAEHGERGWRRAFLAPLPRSATYGAKWAVSVAVVMGSSLAFTVAMLVVQGLMGWLDPRFAFAAVGLEPATLFAALGLATVAALACISLQLWLALRIRSLVGVFALSTLAFMTSAGMMWSKAALGVVPWVLPFSTLAHFTTTGWATVPLLEPLASGVLGGVVVAALAGWDFTRRDVD
jgi:hypothetical protein